MILKFDRTKLKPDLIFFIVGFLVFPAVIIISIISIFNVKNDIENPVSAPLEGISTSIIEVPKNSSEAESVPESEPMTSSINTTKSGLSDSGLKKSLANQQQIQSTGVWNATQYSKGDITNKTYTVQTGDTLWQIAVAYYGNGEEWTKILDKNKDNIGFLPDGEQALIVPNQILSLP